MIWYVYLLECKDDSLYTGITNDLKKRMEAHKKGTGSKYVRSKKFKKMLYSIALESKSEAAKVEYLIKQMDRDDKITYFIKNQLHSK